MNPADRDKLVQDSSALYTKLYAQGYPPSEVQFEYWRWVRGYFAYNNNLRMPALLLDLGCGRQKIKPHFNAAFPHLLYKGLDVATNVAADFVRGADKIPLGNETVHYLWSCEFLEHLELDYLDLVLHELKRVLHPSARSFMSAATEPSGRRVGGKNLHPLVRPSEWWEVKLNEHFVIDDVLNPRKDRYGFLFRVK